VVDHFLNGLKHAAAQPLLVIGGSEGFGRQRRPRSGRLAALAREAGPLRADRGLDLRRLRPAAVDREVQRELEQLLEREVAARQREVRQVGGHRGRMQGSLFRPYVCEKRHNSFSPRDIAGLVAPTFELPQELPAELVTRVDQDLAKLNVGY